MPAARGDLVLVEYLGKLEDGTQFDATTEKSGPMEFRVGDGSIIPGFDHAVENMEVGEIRSVTVEPDAAYGQYNDDLVRQMSVNDFPAPPGLGVQVELVSPDGRDRMKGIVTEIEGENITLDLNHPLAGLTLVYDIKLVGILEKAQ